MIILINGSEREQYSYIINQMHRIRAEVFHDRLGWNVNVKDGLEIDEFDALNPLYVISIDETSNSVLGSLRLLPTTGKNMLRDVFHDLLGENEIVESPTIWESSRFSISNSAPAPSEGRLLSRTTGELFCALAEIGLMAGLSEIVTVFDARMIRIIRAAGCEIIPVGHPKRIGVCMTYAGLFETTESALKKIRQACGIMDSVLEPQSARRLFAA